MRVRPIEILLVDDDQTHVELICRAFEMQTRDVRISHARTLSEAKREIESWTPDLVVVDLRLPDGDGTELLPGSPEAGEFPCIILTGQGDEQAAVDAMKCGALDYVAKSAHTLADMPRHVMRALREWSHIVERKQAEAAVRQSEIRMNAILRASIDPIIAINTQGIVQAVSDSIEEVFGWRPEEMLGTNVEILIPEPFKSMHLAAIDDYLATGKTSIMGETRELKAVRKDGSVFPCEVTVNRVDVPDADEPMFTGTVRDVTKRKRLEEQLRRVDRLASTGTLAAGIAHEINNPISAAWTAAELALSLKEEASENELFEESLYTIVDSIKRCQQLVQNVMKLCRKESSSKMPRDINEVVEDAYRLFRPNAIDRGALIKLELADDLPKVTINYVEIQQVIFNLLENAIEASTGRKEICVSTFAAENSVYLAVVDQGRGLSGAERSRVCDPFYTNRTDGGGIGLGLSIAHGIVQEHGGMLDIASQLGEGTTVTISLPQSAQMGVSQAAG